MYEWPASIAPEPNNYEFISSGFFLCWRPEHRTDSLPRRRAARCRSPRGKFRIPPGDGKAPVPGSPCRSGLSDCSIYLQRCSQRVSPASAPHCVSIQPRSGSHTRPRPFPTAAGRRPKQKAPVANHSAGGFSPLESGQSRLPKGGPSPRAANTIKALTGGFLEWQRLCPNGCSSVSIVKCTWR